MCGISVVVAPSTLKATDAAAHRVRALLSALQSINDRRGPDAHGSERITLRDWELRFRGSVLHLRGSGSPTSQPCLIRAPHLDASMQGPVSSTITNSVEGIHGAETNVRDGLGWLLFNGEIFDGVKVQQSENDTQALEKEIAAAISHPKTRDQCTAGILDVFSRIRGEWATIIWEQRFSRLWLGRDVLGRRSLVWNIPSVLSSFATVENDSIGSLDDAPPLAVSSAIGLECSDGQYGVWEEVPADGLYCIDFGNTKNIHTQSRADTIRHYPWVPHQPDSPISSLRAPIGPINTSLPPPTHPPATTPTHLPTSSPLHLEALTALHAALSTSVRLRTTTTIPRPSNPHHPRLAILFSGGLDCTLLAALAHRHLPLEEPIDLLNVAFENPRALKASHKTRAAGGAAVDPYGVPDRRTGIEGVAELRRVCGGREWRFVRIDVPFEEAMGCKERILGLMAPLDTVMDLSIAMAFWFAARGKGVVKDEESGEEREYTSQARVLFSGLGADEQLAGYGRHTARFQKEGWSGLLTEVSLDVGRIAQRNLGRDDRIVADHGKEVRFPFLDESVVTFLSSLPIYIKADPRYRKGIGEKMLLRQYACSEWMGLSRAGVEPKRAVQFGARTAKMVDGGEKGVDRIGASE